MQDKILQMFFSNERWAYALSRGVDKDISRADIYQLTKPETRIRMAKAIMDGEYQIMPPHIAKIPKDAPGEFRTVYINENVDRVFLSIANDLLFELCPDMIHPSCKAYQKGIGCGRVVQTLSESICITDMEKDGSVGWKSDLSKYFDSVPIEFIDRAFDEVERRHGHSVIIDVLRKYYHCDLYFDEDGTLKEGYQSLKQGCSVASWLADVLLYHIDEELSDMRGEYVRYSDDMIFIGKDQKDAMICLQYELMRMRMKLNPKKVESIYPNRWVKFLGFAIKGADISISGSRLKTFQKEIEARTIKKKDTTLCRAVNAVNRYLYKGDGIHSWATQVLPIINVKSDIDRMNAFVMDALRAVQTGKADIGGLGYVRDQKDGCVARGRGRNVSANRKKTVPRIEGYLTIGCMHNAIRIQPQVYQTLVRNL